MSSGRLPFQREALAQLSKEALIDLLLQEQTGGGSDLEASEAQLRSILDSSLQSVTLISPEQKVQAFNRRSAETAQRVFGRRMAVGQPIENYIFPEDLENFRRAMQLALKGETYWVMKSYLDAQQQTRWFEFNLIPVRNAQDKIIGACMVTQPRTELMLARQNLQTSQDRLQLALKSARMGICEWDIRQGTMHWDDQLLELYGAHAFSRVSPLETWFACIHPEDRLRMQEEFLSLLEQGQERCQQEFRIIRPNGELVWIQASALVEKDLQGQITRVLGIQQDISQTRESQEQLRFQAFLLNTVGQAVVAVDAAGKLTFWNQAAENLYGFSTMKGRGSSLFKQISAPEATVQLAAISKNLYQGQSWSGELPVRSQEGAHLHVLATITPLLDEQGKLAGVVGISSDISALKAAEEKLKQAVQEKDVLLRELYHRTKNNLQVICAMLGLQAMVEVEPRFRQQLQDLENRIHAMALVHQMLYRSEHLSRLNLKEYLQQLGDLLLDSYQAASRQITLEHACEDVFVLMDVAMPCGLIFSELLANIFKHAFSDRQHGTISHSLRVEGDDLFWEIADNGPGLPEGFDPEVQGNMGLQTILVLIEQQLQGQFQLNSSGQGTCWQIRFCKNLYVERV
ncbi:MAG: PAS domain S-box protein [Candidatus Sericytochromatia bacterium]